MLFQSKERTETDAQRWARVSADTRAMRDRMNQASEVFVELMAYNVQNVTPEMLHRLIAERLTMYCPGE